MNITQVITNVGVIGAGQMGAGIAQSFAMAGLNVILNDISDAAIERGLSGIQKSLTKLAEKGRLVDSVDTVLARIQGSTTLAALADTQLVVEAVSENEALKKQLFSQLDELCPADTRSRHRHALYEPGTGDETGRSDSRLADL